MKTIEAKRANIILTGFMGTGKSVVARLLSARLSMSLFDTDALIEADAGMPIAEIFARRGEARFREMERAVLEALLKGEYGSDFVLSTGGGIVVDPKNRESLRALGIVICLNASKECILERVGDSAERPLLKNDAPGAMEELLEERGPFYSDADLQVDTTGKTVEEVVLAIEEFLNEDC